MAYALVIGGKGTRSAAMREIADAIAARGVAVAGFVQRTSGAAPDAQQIEVVRIGDGRTLTLARPARDPAAAADPGACSFAFDPAAFDEARRWVEEGARRADVLVVDGLGKLELGGGGHRAALAHALATAPLVVLSVRDAQLVYALEALGLAEPVAAYTIGEGPAALAAFVDAVVSAAAS